MADWNFEWLGSLKTDFVTELNAQLTSLAKQDGTPSNTQVDMIRWNPTGNRWEKYTGSDWEDLSAAFDMSVLRLGGQAANYYRNASNMNAGTLAAARLPNDFGTSAKSFNAQIRARRGLKVEGDNLQITNEHRLEFPDHSGSIHMETNDAITLSPKLS